MTANYEEQYLALLNGCYYDGYEVEARNDKVKFLVNTSIKATCIGNRVPLLTTKYVNYKAAIIETLWFLKGHTNVKYLNDHGVHIWDQWADTNGDLGPIYGAQWGRQFDDVLELARKEPFSRRLLVDTWQLDDIDMMALPPCHYSFQIINYELNGLGLCTDLVVNMRSSDAFIGMPFNLVQ